MKSKTVAGILALFLGGIGIHHFYLGNGGKGILYLLFCWTLIPALISFFEAIIFLTMPESSFDKKYNQSEAIFQQTIVTNSVNKVKNPANEIKKLHELLNIGAITQEEFEAQKRKILE